MNKFVSFLIVLLAIAVATPVLAEQRLTLSGEFRVRGWHIDQDSDPKTGDKIDNTKTYADQRMRFAGKMSIAEGVSVNFRFDATESVWGTDAGTLSYGSGRAINQGTMHWDFAFIQLDKGMYSLRAGQHYVRFGQSGLDALDNGLALTVKGPVTVTGVFMVDDNNGATDNSDAYYYGLQVGHKIDSYAANVFFAAQDDSKNNNEVYVVGGTFSTKIADSVNLYTELEYFTGDHTAATDAYGLQAFVDASVAVADNVTVGGQFYYAMGDNDDHQYTLIGNGFGGWDPVFSLGTNLHNEQIKYGGGNPYAALGNGAGLYAGRLYASMKASDDLSFAASVFFGVEDEKAKADFKDVLAVGLGMRYAVMANTSLGVQVQYSDYSKRNAKADLEKFEAGTGLFVSF